MSAALSPDRELAAQALDAWWRGIDDFDAVRGTDSALFPQIFWNVGAAIRDRTLAARLKGAARHQWIRNQYLIASCAGVLDVLIGAGIRGVLLKGAAIATAVDDDPGLRAMSDCDVMVPRGRALEAVERLVAAGIVEPPRLVAADLDLIHGLTLFRRPASIATVDLHWRLLREVAAEELSAEVIAGARPVRFCGRECLAAAPEHLVFHAIVHGTAFAHDPHYGWLVDTAKILRRTGDAFDWRRLAAMARHYRFEALIGAALAEMHRVVGVAMPDEIRRSLGRGASLLQRREARLSRRDPATLTGLDELVLSLQRRRRRSKRDLGRPAAAVVPDLLAELGLLRRRFAAVPPAERITLLHGWSAPDVTGRWSTGRFVSFAIHAPERPRPSAVALRAHPLRGEATPAQDVEVYAGLRRLGRLSWSAAGPDPVSREIALPGHVWRGDTAVLRLHVASRPTPAGLGLNGDSRALGLFVEALTVDPPVRDLAAAPLDLSSESGDAEALWHGWSTPEPTGCWTFGPEAVLRWRTARAVAAGAVLRIEIAMVAPGRGEFRGRVGLDGGAAEDLILGRTDPGPTIALTLPTGLPAGHACALRIAIEKPCIPAETVGGDDRRPLGLHVRRVLIEASDRCDRVSPAAASAAGADRAPA
nr:nucleotidyltransferase family protein [Rhodoplanes tepidamans]